jgi:hypothetical protein
MPLFLKQVITTILFLPMFFVLGCSLDVQDMSEDPAFPLEPHILYPTVTSANGQIAAGATTGAEGALEQPIAFPHYTHASELGMECEFCHSEARKSIHAGVPPSQTCVNCHQYVKTDDPVIAQVLDYHNKGESIPWNKVHDLPDYVYFSHKRHVRGGVDCTECHGQVAEMGKKVTRLNPDGKTYGEAVETVMIRETTLQMGWCLDCHASHPSINENYGENADLRRAELKDCWTCHR